MKRVFTVSALIIIMVASISCDTRTKAQKGIDETLQELEDLKRSERLDKELDQRLIADAFASSDSTSLKVLTVKVEPRFRNSIVDIKLKNNYTKEIDGVKIGILLYNNFDEPVEVNSITSILKNRFTGIIQSVVKAGSEYEASFETETTEATKAKAYIYEIHFVDGSHWKAGAGN